jgi:hypothetical protein
MLHQLKRRIAELDAVAGEVDTLMERLSHKESVQPELSIKGQQWYRGARELMLRNDYSGLKEFDDCYEGKIQLGISYYIQSIELTSGVESLVLKDFRQSFRTARSLLSALEAELSSRELPVKTELSFEVSASELDTAEQLLEDSKGQEALIRASGVIARVALERHLYTVVDSRSITIIKNPSHKKHADLEDVMQTLQKSGVITAIQKSQLDGLFKVANNCAHPNEPVNKADVERLIRDGKQLAALIV